MQAAQAAGVAPLLALAAAALQRTGLAALALAKASAKLGYVAAALLAGVVAEGFCTAGEEAPGGADAGNGTFQEAEGTVRLGPLWAQVPSFCRAWHSGMKNDATSAHKSVPVARGHVTVL